MPHISPRGQRNDPIAVQVARVQLVAAGEETTILLGTSCGWDDFEDANWTGVVCLEDELSTVATTCSISYRTTTLVRLTHIATAAAPQQYVSLMGIGRV